MASPRRDRPSIPAAYRVSRDPDGMLTWDQVAPALAGSEIYWVATAGPSGPHLIPIHAVLLDATVYFAGDATTRWARNLTANSEVEIGVDHLGLQVMLRGAARLETPSPETHAEMQAAIAAKYHWQHESGPIPTWIVSPQTVIAFDPSAFATSPTRFRFSEAS